MTPLEQYVSKEKYDELTIELKQLKTVRRKEIAESLEYAKSLGDLSENAEYQEAREAQAKIEDRIITLESTLKNAVIVEERHTPLVGIGSTVTVQKENDAHTQLYHIVGSAESNVQESRISNESPLGAAIIGKKKGDRFSILTPKGSINYSIVDVN